MENFFTFLTLTRYAVAATLKNNLQAKFNHSESIDLSNTRNCHGREHRNFFYGTIGKSSNKILNKAGPVSDYIIQSEYGATHLSTTERVPVGVD